VDLSRLSVGEMVAAAGGAVLLLVMSAFTWFTVAKGVGGRDAWQAFTLIDLLLFLVVLVAIAFALARMAGVDLRPLPVRPGLIVAVAGAVAFLLLLFRLFVVPEIEVQFPGAIRSIKAEASEVEPGIGLYLGLVASAGIAAGGFSARNEPPSRPRRRPR